MTRILIWVALLCYGISSAMLLSGRECRRSLARRCWTMGLFAYLGHVAAAFHFYYQWSHQVGIEETAKQTRELTGFDSGSGLYLNYLFTVVWIADTVFWWAGGLSRYAMRSRWIHWLLHGFFLFMILNGAVVFAEGPARWLGVGILLVLGIGMYVKLRKSRNSVVHD